MLSLSEKMENRQKEGAVVIKTVGKLVLAFFVCLLLFSVLKLVASTIPQNLLRNSLLESSAILDQEGDYRLIYGSDVSTQLENYTTAIMLMTCASDHAVGLEAAFGDYHYHDKSAIDNTQTTSLREQLSGDVPSDGSGWVPYARYWNGYTAVLKPLLVFLNLNEIRMLFVIIGSLLLLLNVCLIARERGVFAGVAFGIPFFAVNFLVAMISLSLSFAFFIALGGVLFILLRLSRQKLTLLPATWAVPFFLLGAATTFLDFLCTPIITLGLPLGVLVYIGRDRLLSIRQVVILLVVAFLCWSLGYGSLWVSKWVLSSLVLGWDVVGNAIEQVAFRVGNSTGAPDAVPMDSAFSAIIRNAKLLFPGWATKVLTILAVLALVSAIAFRNRLRPVDVRTIVTLLVVAALPYAWYLFASNHSYVHIWFTYRAQVVSLVCVLFALETLLHPLFETRAVLDVDTAEL